MENQVSSDIIVVGDSQVRHLGTNFAGLSSSFRRKPKSTVFCYPGARVSHVGRQIGEGLGSDVMPQVKLDKACDVVIHVGGNDVIYVGSEEQVAQYRELLVGARDVSRKVFITSILPRRPRGCRGEWLSRAIGINARLESMCLKLGVGYIYIWDRFYNGSRWGTSQFEGDSGIG